MINAIIGKKLDISQRFTKEGTRIPVTLIEVSDLIVTQVKTFKKDGYSALQVAFLGKKDIKKLNKPETGHLKGAKIKKAPLSLMEISISKEDEEKYKTGQAINITDVIEPGDEVKISGISKGKGFTGGMKRWGFAGGPRTHGQSDRQRAPGSIGQGTTPGRVHKGKKMAGRVGGESVTTRGLVVVSTDSEKGLVLVKGLVPGIKGGLLVIEKTGKKNKK